MFDLGWSEIGLIAVIAVMILGPRELPRAMRTAGQWARKIRLLAVDFQQHLDTMVEEAELSDLREQAKRLKNTDVAQELNRVIDPDDQVRKNFAEVKRTIDVPRGEMQGTAPAPEGQACAPEAAGESRHAINGPGAGSRL